VRPADRGSSAWRLIDAALFPTPGLSVVAWLLPGGVEHVVPPAAPGTLDVVLDRGRRGRSILRGGTEAVELETPWAGYGEVVVPTVLRPHGDQVLVRIELE
jgi:hypothetical protein